MSSTRALLVNIKALTEMRIKKEWERILVAVSNDDRNNRMLSGSDSDDVREGMGNTSGTSSSAEDEDDADADDGNERLQARRGNAKRDINIEEGAVLIASWERTTDLNVRRKVYRELDRIALTVRQRLAQSSTGGVERGKETEGVDDERILHEINTTLYDHLGFTGNVTDYMNPNNSFIDRVLELKMGIPISTFSSPPLAGSEAVGGSSLTAFHVTPFNSALAVVYAAVCRRLNIRIDMIGMPGTCPSAAVATNQPTNSSEQRPSSHIVCVVWFSSFSSHARPLHGQVHKPSRS
jgi:hypothetical protein